MKIYIASSFKNQHAVEMLTEKLELKGYEVLSFVENSFRETYDINMDLETWFKSEGAGNSFKFDTDAVRKADFIIYIGPSGIDAWAEIGMAYGLGKRIFGLKAKDEKVGLMRKMIELWFNNYRDILYHLNALCNCMNNNK